MFSKSKHIGLTLLVAALAGCYQVTTDASKNVTLSFDKSKAKSRVTVELVDSFRDGLAYRGERGVYIITDSVTGREYIGVSGVGISEVGSHTSGKTTVQDER